MSFCKDLLATIFSGLKTRMKYNTVQIVAIKSPTLSIIFRCCQLAIALYIIISMIALKKGYQKFGPVSGTTLIKTKGSAYNGGGLPWYNMTTQPASGPPTDFTQIFDSSDLVFPPMERDATFITTNLWFQNNQTRTTCYPGSDDWWTIQIDPTATDPNTECAAKCQRGTLVNEAETRTGGVWTGGYTLKQGTGKSAKLINCYCELYTWCPDENIPKTAGPFAFKLLGVENWTVSFRQNVEFKAFGVVTSNLDPKDNPVPPIYAVSDMLNAAGLSYERVREKGAVVVMQSEYNCNLDYSADSCIPDVKWVNLGQSFNFRRVEYLDPAGMAGSRQLIKHFGLRIVVIISGTGGRFEPAALFTTLGAGIGLLAVASLVADFAAVNILGKRALYEKAKFKEVKFEAGGRIRGLSESKQAGKGPGRDVELGAQPSAAIVPSGSPASDAAEEREESWGKRRIST